RFRRNSTPETYGGILLDKRQISDDPSSLRYKSRAVNNSLLHTSASGMRTWLVVETTSHVSRFT
ncbi:hypothetical protein, partial [Polaromonas sp. CF318]|uniref:hypothetical protein n=1 Tax=Polaromonas sp. CF318 TaxID=1144318 RepID=UPI001EE67355